MFLIINLILRDFKDMIISSQRNRTFLNIFQVCFTLYIFFALLVEPLNVVNLSLSLGM